MVIELSLLKNDIKDKLSIVILCAGKGTRLQKITKNLPKPLIKVEKLNNISILHNTINNLIKLEIEQIGIVIGHLGEMIRDFISTLKKNDVTIKDKLIIIDTENQYKFGPLSSFLSITKNKDFFTSRNHYLVIPGDTIFNYDILQEVFIKISDNLNFIKGSAFTFYRNIGLKSLKEIYNKDRIISNAEVMKSDSDIILKKISQLKIREIPLDTILNQLIPITVLSYDLINEILNLEKRTQYKMILETLNYMISKGKKIFSFEIENKSDFYDIDYINDFKKLKKKRKGQ